MPTEATPLNDPNVKVPRAIRGSAAKADELHKQIYNKDQADPPKPADPPVAQADPPKPADPPATQQADPPVTAEPVAQPVEQVTSKGNEAPKDGYEHAYKSMKGRYESARDANRALTERVSGLEQQLAALAASQAARPATKELQPETLLTPKEVEDYGADFLGVVGKKAKEIVSPEVAALRQEVDGLKQTLATVGKSVTTSARDQMKADLKSKVPNWEAVNNSDEFKDWLSLQDPYSGAIRWELLKQAWGRNETARVLNFFQGFLAQEATLAPADTRPDPSQGKIPLETFAAPGRAKSAADIPRSPAEKPIITRAFIADFYLDSANGKYRGREKEKADLEQQIITATREGRVS
jgi:hypothetical protein